MVPNICIIFHHNRMKHGHLLECCLCKPWFYNYFQIQNGKHLQYRPFIWHWNKRNSRLIVFTQLFIEFLYHWNNWSNVNWWMDKSTQLHLKLERKKIFFLEIQIKKKKKKNFQMNHLFIHIQNGAILIFMVFQKLMHIFSVLIWFLAQHPITLTDERILMINIFQKKRIFNFSHKRRNCDFCQW